jgi:crossover junction endodeoxyribonuclease RuvC
MLILGLDPGSERAGYGLIESRSGTLRCLDQGLLRPPAGLPLLERLPHLASGVEELIARSRPDAVAAEDLFVARNSRVALHLGHVRGAMLLPLLRAGIPVHEYAPRQVKKTVTGYGAAEKEQVRRMVSLLLGYPERSLALDASDALAVAICHAHLGRALPHSPQHAAR